MGLFSMLGRFLLAWFFIFSAGHMEFKFLTDVRVRKDFATKVSGVMDVLEYYFSVTDRLAIVGWFVTFFMTIKETGGFLFLFGKLSGTFLLMFYFLIATPIVYDFYHYKVGDPEFVALLHDFMQDMALCGALLFLMELKNTIYWSQSKKTTPKSKRRKN